MRIVIAGLGAAGLAAVMAARRADPDAEILVIDNKPFDMLHTCGLPFAVQGDIAPVDRLKAHLQLERMRAELVRPCRVTEIDDKRQIVTSVSLDTGREISGPYDKLILCLGARPRVPAGIEGLARLLALAADPTAFRMASAEDAQNLRRRALPGARAVVAGAGPVGLEIAAALRRLECRVTLLEHKEHPLPAALDWDMARPMNAYLAEIGVDLRCGATLERVMGADRVESVLVNGEILDTELLVLAAGCEPRTDAARAAGAQVDEHGIVVNQRMETSLPNVYAAGDCARAVSLLDGRPIHARLASIAWAQGAAAGANAAGADESYPGATGAFVSRIGDIEVSSAGYTAAQAVDAGYEPVSGRLADTTAPVWHPGALPVSVKVVACARTRRVIGAQAVGQAGAMWRVNVVSAAMAAGMTLEQLARLEFAYCPALSHTDDPLARAARQALRKL